MKEHAVPVHNPKSPLQNRIESIFAGLRRERRAALMPFVTAGYPTLEVTAQVIPALERAGASVVELGIPFSDPIADGPVIAASMHQALQAGVTPRSIFAAVHRIRAATRLGIVAMVSDSIITRIGPEQFVSEAANAGFDGLIVPDIDIEAVTPLCGLAHLHGLTLTLLIAPTTAPERIKTIVERCSGFIYLLARVGLTGETHEFDLQNLKARVDLIRQHSDLPIAVGFGISSREHVAAVAGVADAAIVGSALVRRMNDPDTAVASAAGFLSSLNLYA